LNVRTSQRQRKPEPIKPEWNDNPVLVITSGDLVLLVFDHMAPDPADPNQKHKYNVLRMAKFKSTGILQRNIHRGRRVTRLA
jgi:hypothetical protein